MRPFVLFVPTVLAGVIISPHPTEPFPAVTVSLVRDVESRDAEPNEPRFNLGDILPELNGPVIDGCTVVPCAEVLLKTGAACIPAVIAAGGNVVKDLECLFDVLKDVNEVPAKCANCPEAIQIELQKHI